MTVVPVASRVGRLAVGGAPDLPSRAGTIVMYGAGDLAMLADVVGDAPDVMGVALGDDRIEVRALGCQGLVPRLVELATCCDVELGALAIVTAGHRRRDEWAPD